MKAVVIACVLLAAPASAAPVMTATAETEVQQPAEPPVEPPVVSPQQPPATRGLTAADVHGAPVPGDESGRLDEPDRDSIVRRAARGALFVPRTILDWGLSPIRGLWWLQDRYALDDLYYRTFYNADRTIGLYPTVIYNSGLGLSAGAAFADTSTFGEHERLALQATTGMVTDEPYRESFLASVSTGDRISKRLQLGLAGNFDRRPSDPFYGIGNGDIVAAPAGAPIDPRTSTIAVPTWLRYQEARVAATADLRIVDRVHVRATGALTQIELARSTTGPAIDEVYDPADLVGWMNGVEHAYGELALSFDERKRVSLYEPRDLHADGWLATAFTGRVHRLDGGVDYWHYGFETQYDWRLAKGPRVIATRFHVDGVTGSLSDVPFVELPYLGGGQFLRGYDYERFRDRIAAVGTVEYEWDLAQMISASVFVDVGRVYDTVSEVTLANLRVGYGVGLEIHDTNRFWLEASLASSIDGGIFASLSFNPTLDSTPRWR